MEVVERESTDLKSITLAFTIVTLYMKHVGGADSIHKVCAGTKLGRFVDWLIFTWEWSGLLLPLCRSDHLARLSHPQYIDFILSIPWLYKLTAHKKTTKRPILAVTRSHFNIGVSPTPFDKETEFPATAYWLRSGILYYAPGHKHNYPDSLCARLKRSYEREPWYWNALIHFLGKKEFDFINPSWSTNAGACTTHIYSLSIHVQICS